MQTIATDTRAPLVTVIANKLGVEPTKLITTLKQTVFKQGKDKPEVTEAQLMMLLIVANEHNLNPLTGELYAFPDKAGGITAIVSIDGWIRMINEHPEFDGMEFADLFENGELQGITCRMYRRDRKRPIEVTEYMSECKRETDPWKKWPARMLRHKATIQCARYAFGFAGIHDPDEGERIKEAQNVEVKRTTSRFKTTNQKEVIIVNGDKVDTLTGEVIPDSEPAKISGSPAFTALLKKLEISETEGELKALYDSKLFKKINANEKAAYTQLVAAKLAEIKTAKA